MHTKEKSAASESRSLQAGAYSIIDTVQAGSSANSCSSKRYSKISDTRRLATFDCDSNFNNFRRVQVYEFDADTETYNDTPIFTTPDVAPMRSFGFSPDGKTIITMKDEISQSCKGDGMIYSEDSDGQWTHRPESFFPCDGTATYHDARPGQHEIGTNYDGTMIAIGSSSQHTGAFRIFEKQPDGSWLMIYSWFGDGYSNYFAGFANMSRDGKKAVWNYKDDTASGQVLRYIERKNDGSWTEHIALPTQPAGGYVMRGSFSADGSRLAVSTNNQGIYVLDYDGSGGWTVTKRFTNSLYNSADGNGMVDISDNGERVIYCGDSMGSNTIAIFDEQTGGTWTDHLWGFVYSRGGCAIDGSGGLLVVSFSIDSSLKAYRDSTIELNPLTPSPTPAPTITKAGNNNWFMDNNGDASEETISNDIIKVSLPFNTTNKEIGALVYQKNCLDEFASDDYFDVDTTSPTSTAPDGFIQFNTTLKLNITAINGTAHWNEFTDGTRGGWVEACAETYLSFTDDPALGNDGADGTVNKVVFRNNIVNISISLNANFQVDEVSVVREDGINEEVKTEYSEFITAYECNKADPYTVAEDSYNQGDEITICVTDESDGIVQVEEFVNLIVDQDGSNNYNFILDTLYNPDITTPVCLEATTSHRRVCYASIRVLARFFNSETPGDLTISGSVYVIRDGRRVRRNLHMALPATDEEAASLDVSGRRVVEDEEGSGIFEVKVSLISTDDSTDDSVASDHIVGGAATGLMAMAVGAAGAALMV